MKQILLFSILVFFTTQASAQTTLITCATSGLGKEIASRLAGEKHDLILTGRNVSELHTFSTELKRRFPVTIDLMALDFGTLDQVDDAAQGLNALLNSRKLDGVVLLTPRPSFSNREIPDGLEWQKNFQDAFIGPLQFLRHLSASLNEPSSVVVISGITSKFFIPAYVNTNVIRLAWTAEVKNLSHQLSQSRTRVNAISPGVILTRHVVLQLEKRAQAHGRSVLQELHLESASIPARRQGEPGDVASLTKFLLSSESGFINAENIALDGGIRSNY